MEDTNFLKYSSKNELLFVAVDKDDGVAVAVDGTFVVVCSLGVVVERLFRNELLLVVCSRLSSSSSSSVLFSDESRVGWSVVDEL